MYELYRIKNRPSILSIGAENIKTKRYKSSRIFFINSSEAFWFAARKQIIAIEEDEIDPATAHKPKKAPKPYSFLSTASSHLMPEKNPRARKATPIKTIPNMLYSSKKYFLIKNNTSHDYYQEFTITCYL